VSHGDRLSGPSHRRKPVSSRFSEYDWIPAPVFTGVTFFRRNDE